MSGGARGRCHFDNAMILFMNFELPATCRVYMRYVVQCRMLYPILGEGGDVETSGVDDREGKPHVTEGWTNRRPLAK